jgi:hypothetical protein
MLGTVADRQLAPMIYSWSAANTAGETKKKVTTGMLIVGQCVGNVRAYSKITVKSPMLMFSQIIGPTLYTTAEAPLYRRGLLSK